MIENITFRYLTPIFSHNRFANFEHSGQHKDASYTISLKGYNGLLEDTRSELLKYGNATANMKLQDIDCSEHFSPCFTNVFLVIDVVQPLTQERFFFANSKESQDIFEQIVTSLRLHITYGLLYEYTYIFRSPPLPRESFNNPSGIRQEQHNYTTSRSNTLPLAKFRLLGDDSSILRADEENSCKMTFQRLLDQQWDETKTYDKLLKLALEYHRLSFTLERADHAFLILMVVFEALFKQEKEKDINNAAKRIAKFLATAQTELKPIRKAFLSRPSTHFSLIRNGIAHGDPTLDRTIVNNHYLELYGYITKAIIKLINVPDSTIGTNYYNDLEQYIDIEFSKLKLS